MQSFEINKEDLERIHTALEGTDDELKLVLEDYHASEIAIIFEGTGIFSALIARG